MRQNEPLSTRTIGANLLAFGLAHAAVDATSTGVLFAAGLMHGIPLDEFYYLVLLYNLLAFALQPLWGRVFDRVQVPRLFAVLGCLIVMASATMFDGWCLLAVFLAGTGNAMFHVGAGSICLNLTPNRASGPGIFVAPGALGLLIGVTAGKTGYFVPWLFIMILGTCCIGLMLVRIPKIDYAREDLDLSLSALSFVFLFLLISVGIRSLVGFSVDFPWKEDFRLVVALTVAITAGKAVGGVLADRYGWIKVGVIGLVASAPLITLGGANALLATAGMCLFNMTMAVTLVAVALMLPGRPGFAFGAPCLALFLGMLPTATEVRWTLADSRLLLPIVLVSAGLFYVALRSMGRFGNVASFPGSD